MYAAAHAVGRNGVCTEHFSAWNDVMAAILNVWRHLKRRTPSINEYLVLRTKPPNFIWIGFDMSNRLFLRRPPTRTADELQYESSSWSKNCCNLSKLWGKAKWALFMETQCRLLLLVLCFALNNRVLLLYDCLKVCVHFVTSDVYNFSNYD